MRQLEIRSPAAAVVALALALSAIAGRPAAGAAMPGSVAGGTAGCTPGATVLCLNDGRFRVEVTWEDFQGGSGSGQAMPLTADTGYFWFFNPANAELVVKVLDGRPVNGHFWVFYGALSNVAYTLTVTDTVGGGPPRTYVNPAHHFGSVGDTDAFPDAGEGATGVAARTPPDPPSAHTAADFATACTPSTTALCLNGGRFRVEAAWRNFQGGAGVGRAVPLTADTGYFWFFNPANVELVVKVLDGRVLNDYFWVFYGALSNVEYDLTVTDTTTGVRRTYHNPAHHFASVGDTAAFGGRPLAGFGFTPRWFADVEEPWTATANVASFLAELDGHRYGVWALTRQWFEVDDDGRALIGDYDDLLPANPRLARRIVAALQFAELDSGVPRIDPAAGWQPTWEDWNVHDGWDLFTAAARRMAERYRPPFFSIGVEIDGFARRFPEEFHRFATIHFPAIAAAVREVSPDTVTFPGFQFERMIGDLHGIVDPEGNPGCAGCVPFPQINSLSGVTYPPSADLLNQFPPAALTHVGFTTYPYFNRDLATPADVPDDYYSRIYDVLDAGHQAVRLVLTETGWPANATMSEDEACAVCAMAHPEAHPQCFPAVVPAGACTGAEIASIGDFYRDWLGGEAEQAAWVERFFDLADSLGAPVTVWTLLHDGDPRNPATLVGLFTHAGLRSHDGTVDRPGWTAWLARTGEAGD